MRFVFRCDATEETGLGHLSRSLALAEAHRRAGGSGFFLGHWAGAASRMLAGAAMPFAEASAATGSDEDATELALLAGDAAGVVADSYAIDARWVAQLRAAGVPVVLIDDFARLTDYRACAGILNFTIGAWAMNYPGIAAECRALGTEYFLARERLLKLRQAGRTNPTGKAKRVLISIGGGDRRGVTLPIYRALKQLAPGLEVRALIPNGAELARLAGLPEADFPAQASDLATHYAWADRCVSGGGITKYECGYLGIPVAIFSQTPEQQAETDQFCAAGLGWDLIGAAGWEARLVTFLANGGTREPVARAAASYFPVDGVDRAAVAVGRFINAAEIPARALPLARS